MEKPVEPDIPLAILHHEEHLMFPGYDAMIGEGYGGQDEEVGRKLWAAENLRREPKPDACGGSVVESSLYKKREKMLFVVVAICILLALIGFVAYISVSPSQGPREQASFEGLATFNDYSFQIRTQGSTVCGGHAIPALKSDVYGAAAGDLSPSLSAGLCEGSQNTTTPQYDMSVCTLQGGQAPDVSSYSGPACQHARCDPATCYKVDNLGPVGGATGEVIGSVMVQIIDGCPAGSAWNYCKTDIDPAQRCSSPITNALDIDFNAYETLYPGKNYSSGNPEGNANLQIRITPTIC